MIEIALSLALLGVLVFATAMASDSHIVGWLVAGLAAASGGLYLVIVDELSGPGTTLASGLGGIQFAIALLGAIHALHMRAKARGA